MNKKLIICSGVLHLNIFVRFCVFLETKTCKSFLIGFFTHSFLDRRRFQAKGIVCILTFVLHPKKLIEFFFSFFLPFSKTFYKFSYTFALLCLLTTYICNFTLFQCYQSVRTWPWAGDCLVNCINCLILQGEDSCRSEISHNRKKL